MGQPCGGGPMTALRPIHTQNDHVVDGECRYPVLQLIPVAHWRIFKYSPEFCFARSIHNRMLARHGYEYDKKIEFDSEARKKWHGLRRCAIRVTNGLLAQVLAVADQKALTLARRFRFFDRYAV
jgi:hypothetical protein